METKTNNKNLLDNYFIFLKNLEAADKLRLISELSASMLDDSLTIRKEKLNKAFGSLDIDMSAQEFADDLRKSRYFDSSKEIKL